MFFTPLFCPTKVLKKSSPQSKKNLRSLSVAPRQKMAAAGKKFGNSFFCTPEAQEKFSDKIFILVQYEIYLSRPLNPYIELMLIE